MDMRVELDLLTPGVQHAEETNFRTEVIWVASDFEKRFGTSAKQEIVEDLLVLQHQWPQSVGQCEDDVQVAGREQFSSPRSNPAFPSRDLTLRAVAISTTMVGDGPMAAAGALVEMTAQCRGATARNGQQHFDMPPTNPLVVSLDEGGSRAAD